MPEEEKGFVVKDRRIFTEEDKETEAGDEKTQTHPSTDEEAQSPPGTEKTREPEAPEPSKTDASDERTSAYIPFIADNCLLIESRSGDKPVFISKLTNNDFILPLSHWSIGVQECWSIDLLSSVNSVTLFDNKVIYPIATITFLL